MSLSRDKLIATLHIDKFDASDAFNIDILFNQESFTIHFIEPINNRNLTDIKNIFYPLISTDCSTINMNYIYLKEIYLDNNKILNIIINNPISSEIFKIIFNNIKYKNKFSFFKSVPSKEEINKIVWDIKTKCNNKIKKDINNFINIIEIFSDFISIQRKYNKIIDNLFSKAFQFGIKYYESNIQKYASSQEKINFLPKKDLKFIEDYLINYNEQVRKKFTYPPGDSSKDFQDQKEKTENTDQDTDLISIKDLFQNYPSFNKFLPEIKRTTSYLTESTIRLLFNFFNINFSEDNNTNIFKNDFNTEKNKWFKEHSIVPNNSVDNIISNSSQIIQRKFFEFLFKKYFSDIKSLYVDKNKTLTTDEFFEILLILKRAKSILFINQNLEYFSDYPFLNQENKFSI